LLPAISADITASSAVEKRGFRRLPTDTSPAKTALFAGRQKDRRAQFPLKAAQPISAH
jgi:hypothetical protein